MGRPCTSVVCKVCQLYNSFAYCMSCGNAFDRRAKARSEAHVFSVAHNFWCMIKQKTSLSKLQFFTLSCFGGFFYQKEYASKWL